MKYLKIILIALLIILPCALAVLIYNDKIAEDSPVFYKQGTEFYNKGDYQNAYYNYSKIKWISPLYPMALYKQAKCAQNLGDFSTASLKYNSYIEKATTDIFLDSANYNLAKSYFNLKENEKAKEIFLKIKEKQGNKPAKEDYYLGLLYKKENKDIAGKYFKSYLNGIQKEQIKETNNAVLAAEELSKLGVSLNNNDIKLIGLTYYDNKKYSKALEYISKLPMSEYWDYMVIINHYAGNKIVAKKLIESGLPLYSSGADTERLSQIYNIYTSYMTGSKVRNWTQMYKMTSSENLKGNDYVMFKLAGLLPKDKALELYKTIEEKYPQSEYAPQSLWNVFWNEYYVKRNYAAAEKLAIKHIKQYKKDSSSTKMVFWLAKSQLRQNKNTEAHNVLTKLASKFPDDYYGLRAESIINKRNDFWKMNSSENVPSKEELGFPISLSNLDIKDLKLINTIFSLGDYEIWLDADFNDNKIVESWFEARKGKKSASMVMARDTIDEMSTKPPFISAAYKLAYPLYYTDEINKLGKKFNIDPYFIMSLMREESYFNANAKSSTYATGLMQIMPATANFIITKYNLKLPVNKDITNPDINMYLGCIYIKYLLERFNGNYLYVIAAYNGGEGSVNRWLKQNNTDTDEFIENIPFDETHNYVKKIFRTYHLYKKIYK